MTLLNNYYIIQAAIKENSSFLSGYSDSSNFYQSFSSTIQQPCTWDTLQHLRLPNGLTLREVKDDLVSIPLVNVNAGKDMIAGYHFSSTVYNKPIIGIQNFQNQSMGDQYMINNTVYVRNFLNNNSISKPLYQTPNDIKPNKLFYGTTNGVKAQRQSDYVMVGSGIESDTTPVTKNDYRINNILDNDVISITNETDFFGRYHITLANISNAEQIIREIGIFNCHLILFSGRVTDNTEFKNIYSEITGLECVDGGTTTNTKDCAVNIPILFAKMKLATPIILQPGESIPLIWERKW